MRSIAGQRRLRQSLLLLRLRMQSSTDVFSQLYHVSRVYARRISGSSLRRQAGFLDLGIQCSAPVPDFRDLGHRVIVVFELHLTCVMLLRDAPRSFKPNAISLGPKSIVFFRRIRLVLLSL